MTSADRRKVYRKVAELHADSIDQGFLSTLGLGFLALMYEAVDEAKGSVLLVEHRNGRIVGFVSGACGMRSIYLRMLRSPIRLGFSLLPSLVRLGRLKRIFDILRYEGGGDDGVDYPEAELLSIAVDPDARGQGVADSLFGRLSDHFRNQGFTAFKIVVGDELAPAQRFYSKMGARPAGRVEVHAGEGSTVYIHHIPAPD